MKKLLLIIMVGLFALTSTAQSKKAIQTYQINVEGSSNGLTIESGFIIEVASIYTSQLDSANWKLELHMITYSDDSYSNAVTNDSIPSLIVYTLPITYKESKMRKKLDDFIRPRLDDIYGKLNVVEL